jgi:hypothetical protein
MDSYGIFEHIQFYLVGSAICTALVSIIYIPTMRQASNSQKGLASALIFTVCALIAYAFWGYSPSYNSSVFGVVAPAHSDRHDARRYFSVSMISPFPSGESLGTLKR